jgi:hypothetical protein
MKSRFSRGLFVRESVVSRLPGLIGLPAGDDPAGFAPLPAIAILLG